jgi:hypothetical protein
LAAQTTQTYVLAVVAPPAPAAQNLGVASGIDATLSTCSFGGTFSLNPQRLSLTFTNHTSKMAVSPPRRAKERARFPAVFAVTKMGP